MEQQNGTGKAAKETMAEGARGARDYSGLEGARRGAIKLTRPPRLPRDNGIHLMREARHGRDLNEFFAQPFTGEGEGEAVFRNHNAFSTTKVKIREEGERGEEKRR